MININLYNNNVQNNSNIIQYKKDKGQTIKYLFFTLENFTIFNFGNQIRDILSINNTYTIYIKLSFATGTEFRMAGNQIGFILKNNITGTDIEELYTKLNHKINLCMEEYNYIGTIDGIEISIKTINILPQLKLQNIPISNIPNRITNKKDLSNNFSSNILPLSTNEAYYGELLEGDKKLNAFHLIEKNIDTDNNWNISIEDKIFLYKVPQLDNKSYFIVLNNREYLPMTDIPKHSEYNFKHIFDGKHGFHILTALDNNIRPIPTTHNDPMVPNLKYFERTIGNHTITIDGDKVIKSESKVKLKPITSRHFSNKNLQDTVERNIKFGTFDLETFVNTDGLSEVFAAGFRTYDYLSSNIETASHSEAHNSANSSLSSDNQSNCIATENNITIMEEEINIINHSFIDTSNKKVTGSNTLFYITDFNNSSQELILGCINQMLQSKYHNYTFYCHNFGNYDLYFIYKVLEEFNLQIYNTANNTSSLPKTATEQEQNGQVSGTVLQKDTSINNPAPTKASSKNFSSSSSFSVNNTEVICKTKKKPIEKYYLLNLTFRDDQVLKLDIKVRSKINNKIIKISFIDSLNILVGSLEQLAKDFNVQTQKGKFPYTFVKENNLKYEGPVPSIKYYPGLSKTEYNDIINLFTNRLWNLKQETFSYLDKDLLSLLEILNELSKILYFHFGINITEGMTISRLALNLFIKNYYPKISSTTPLLKSDRVIPLINKNHMFNFIYEAYYGGITEVYKPYGQDLKYIDVNSLYPFAALNALPGCSSSYLEVYDIENHNSGLDLDKLFGFFYAKVKTNKGYLGLLPLRTSQGLIFPIGEFEGTWTSEELKFARDNGYEIKVIRGYNFNKVENIFSKYIHDLYDLKKTSTHSMKKVSKSLLNNLIGRFGLNIIKPITEILDKNEIDYISSTRLIKSHKVIMEDKFLITYLPGLNNQICLEHGIDPQKVFEFEKNENNKKELPSSLKSANLATFSDTSIAISAMVNSYARIFMHKVKLEVIRKGGEIYYSDTDSLVYKNCELPIGLLGPDLGQFKEEFIIKEGYFISNKTYCLVLNNKNKDNGLVIKAKGVLKESLTLRDFKDMYLSKLKVKAYKSHTFKSFEFATVNLNKKEIILNYDSYTKRNKIFNKKGLWIDTSPLSLSPSNPQSPDLIDV